MKILAVRLHTNPAKSLKALVDVEFDGGITVRDFRVVERPGHRFEVWCPQISYRDNKTGDIVFKRMVTLSQKLQEELDTLALSAWAKEKTSGTAQKKF